MKKALTLANQGFSFGAGEMNRTPEAHQWLVQNGFIGGDAPNIPTEREVMQVMKSCPAPASAPGALTPKPRKASTKIVATYDYRDESGELLMQVVRMEPKTFRQRRPDPTARDGWAWSVKDVRVVPYRLPELLAAPEAVVYLVEGEKDADRLTQQDLVDRVISVECPVIASRQSSSQQWKVFEQALPGVLGALFELVVGGLRELPNVSIPLEDRPRLVEFVLLGMAMTKATGAQPGEFLDQFKATRAETVARTLDASPVAAAVLEFIDTIPSGIEASVKDILMRLESYKPMGAEAWPRTPKGLGDALRRASPALRQMGVECKSLGNVGGKVKWVIRKMPSTSRSPEHGGIPTRSEDDFKTSMTSLSVETSAMEVL